MSNIDIEKLYIFEDQIVYETEYWPEDLDSDDDIDLVSSMFLRDNFDTKAVRLLDVFTYEEAERLIDLYLSKDKYLEREKINPRAKVTVLDDTNSRIVQKERTNKENKAIAQNLIRELYKANIKK